MGSLRKRIASYVASLVASTALTTGDIAHAANTPAPHHSDGPHTTQNFKQNFINPHNFYGKSFEQRMLQAERIVQQYNLEHGTQFSDIFEILVRQAPTQPAELSPKAQNFLGGHDYQAFTDQDTINDTLELVRLGCLVHEIDRSLSYSEQLRSCGFNLLADIAENKSKMTDLSDIKRAEVLAQFEVSSNFFNMPNLMEKIKKQNKNQSNPITEDSLILNGHKLDNENLYFVQIAKRVQQQIANETTSFHTLNPTDGFVR